MGIICLVQYWVLVRQTLIYVIVFSRHYFITQSLYNIVGGHFNIGQYQGRFQDFKLGGAHLKKLRRAREVRQFLGYFVWKITILRQKIIFLPIVEGGAKFVWVFRVKNHDFTPFFGIYGRYIEVLFFQF